MNDRIKVLVRVARAGLAVSIALAVLMSLRTGLLVTRRAVADIPVGITDQAQNDDEPCPIVAKTVEPSNPDTGDVVTITFVLTGVGPRSLDVALVQDVSGSMDDPVAASNPLARLQASKVAAWDFVKELQPTDWVAVIAYSNRAQPVHELTTNRDDISGAISSLQAHGYTNISDGLKVASTVLLTSSARPSDTVKKVIVLLTDGIANRPVPTNTAGQRALTEAQIAASKAISIFTIGFGQDADHDFLQDIARAGGGGYYFAPSGDELHTAYMSIALRLRNLTIVDVLPPKINVDCPPVPPDRCIESPNGSVTVTWPISDDVLLEGGPVTVAFTVTVNWDPGESGPINGPNSCVRYDKAGEEPCDPFDNPTITVGGRKIAGFVFRDLNRDGIYDIGAEDILSREVVTTSNGLTSRTDISGVYLFRTSTGPPLTVTLSIPTNYVTTTSEITHIPQMSGTYHWDFGLYPAIEGISLSLLRIEPHPEYHGEPAVLHYSIVNQDQEDEIVNGTAFIMDSISRTLDERGFVLDPGGRVPLLSPPVIVSQDIVITLTAIATYGIPGILPVSACIALPLCPEDSYERDYDEDNLTDENKHNLPPLTTSSGRQVHDFSQIGDKDWVWFQRPYGEKHYYTFIAHPLSPQGVAISLTLLDAYSDCLGFKSNSGNVISDVRLIALLPSTGGLQPLHVLDWYDYYLQIESAAEESGWESSCWTEYELWVKETSWDELQHVWLPVALKDF